MSKQTERERVASLLESAASYIDPINIDSLHPQHGLVEAARLATAAWQDVQPFVYPPDKKPLRVSVVAVRAMAEVAKKAHSLQPSDAAMLANAARSMREVATRVLHDPRVARAARMTHSATGARYSPDSALTRFPSVLLDQDIHAAADMLNQSEDPIGQIADMSRMKSKLPVDLAHGKPYATAIMPIIVFPLGPINKQALDRAGVSWIKLTDTGGSRKDHTVPTLISSPGEGSVVALNRQLVLGFRKEDVRNTRLMQAAVDDVSRRSGPHVCPVPNQAMIFSAGSHLGWLWLVPRAVMNSRALIVRKASFPWQGEHNPESHRLAVRDEDAMSKELKELDNMQDALIRKGQSLDDRYLLRQSELREKLHRSENVDKSMDDARERIAKNARDRQEMEARSKAKARPKLVKLEELEEQLEELGKPSLSEKQSLTILRRGLVKSIRALKAEIEADRQEVMRVMRQRPKV